MGTINPQTLEGTKFLLKEHYAPYSDVLIRADNKWLRTMEETEGFSIDFGGRKMVWALQTNRAHNVGSRGERGFFPGMSSEVGDAMASVGGIVAEVNRGYCFASHALTGADMAPVHGKYDMGLGLSGGGALENIIQMTQDDFNTFLTTMALGDQVGMLGVVVSASVAAGITTIVLQPASTLSARGIHGTQRLQENTPISFVRAAHWAVSARTALIDSDINNLDQPMFKVLSATGPHDVSASPSIRVTGDLTGGGGSGAIAVGDVIVDGLSRPSASGGGNAADDTGLTNFKGLFSYIDNGLFDSLVFGNSRTTNPQLNSIVDNNLAGRAVTAPLLQSIITRLSRRLGADEKEVGLSDLILFTEKSVKDGYVADAGEAQKRYEVKGDLQKLLPGWHDVGWQFLGSDKAIPWATDHMLPYGHGLLAKKNTLKVAWDVRPGVVNLDGLTLRQIEGKDEYYFALRAYGNFIVTKPWLCARLTGLNGAF